MNPFILFIVVYPNAFKDNRDAIVKTLRFILSIITFISVNAFASDDLQDFMTPHDLMDHAPTSGINLHNNRNSAVTVYGLYVRQYASVAPGASCNSQVVLYPTTQNAAAGSFVTPTDIKPGKSAVIGSNYLYNMIYEAIYYLTINMGTAPCALPGCTWGADSTMFNWCIYLGALSPVTTSTGYTARIPPFAAAASSGVSYNYNLINNYITLGPISCNDQTLTCSAANQQTQSFS